MPSQQRLDWHAMAGAADHEGLAQRPVALFVKAPRHLDPLHRFAALSTVRGGPGKEFRSVHHITSFAFVRSVGLTREHYPRSLAAMDDGPESTRRLGERVAFDRHEPSVGQWQRAGDCFRAQDWFSLCGEEATSGQSDT